MSLRRRGGAITINPSIVLTKDTSLLTTGSGYISGANIILASTVSGLFGLTLNGGIRGSVSTQSIQISGLIQIFSGLDSIINGAVISTAGSFNLINLGDMTFTGFTQVFDSFTQTGGGQLLLDANIVVTGTGIINIEGPLVLQADISLDTAESNGNITLGSEASSISVLTQGGFFNLDVDAGTGDVFLIGDIGSSSSGIGSVRVSATNATLHNIYTEGDSIDIMANSVFLAGNSTFDTTVGGGSGTITLPTVDGFFDLTMQAGSSVILVGAIGGQTPLHDVTISGAGNFSLPSITTENGFIEINPSVLLSSSPTLSTSGGDITFASTISGNQTLTLNAGDTGSILLAGAVSGLADFTIQNANDLTAESISAGGLTQQAGSGTSTFQGDLSLGALGMNLTGSSFFFSDFIVIESVGNVSIYAESLLKIGLATDFSIRGSFSESGEDAMIETGGNITTTSTISFESPITLTANVIWDSSRGNSPITLQSYVVSDPEGHDLEINAGIGDITLNGSLGTPQNGLGEVILVASDVSMESVYTVGQEILVLADSIMLNANGNFNTAIDSPLGANITLPIVDGFQDLLMNAGTLGTISVDTIGGNSALHNVTITSLQDFIIPNITTALGKIWIYPPTVLDGDITLSTIDLSQGADIHFFSTVDGEHSGLESLTLNAGSGNISFDEPVGLLVRLGVFSIVSADNVNSGEIVATSIVQQSGLETTTFAGLLNTSSSGGIVLTGNNFVFKGSVTSGDGGNLEISETGSLTVEAEADILLGGFFLQSGGGEVLIGGDITASTITFSDPVVLTGNVVWDTKSDNGDIVVESSLDGPGGLTIDVGLGSVIFEGTVGKTARLDYLNIEGDSTLFEQSIVKTMGDQTYQSLVNLEKNTVFSTASGNIQVAGLLDGTANDTNVVFSLGGGNLTVSSLGSRFSLGAVVASNSGSFSAEDITAKSLSVTGGLSNVQFQGPIELSGLGGITVDAGSIGFGSSISASHFFFRAWTGPIYAFNSSTLITMTGLSTIHFGYMNAIQSPIGSFSAPVEIDTKGLFYVGANNRADFSGPLPSLRFKPIPSNPPCILTYNGEVLLSCSDQSPQNLFDQLPKDLFYVTGLYASWSFDNLSNDWYFLPESVHPEENNRDRHVYLLRSEKTSVPVPEKKPLISKILKKKVEIR